MSVGVRLDRAGALLVDTWLPYVRGTGSLSIPVLMYHSVSDDPEPGVHPYYRLTISPARFAEQMRWLADHEYTVVSLESAVEASLTGRVVDRPVVVTFDDGFADFLDHAWPVLESLGFVATVFLPTAFIGDARRRFKERECLTWPEVLDLSTRGVAFGSHTVTHRVLTDLPWPDVCAELRQSRAQIEAVLSKPVTSFAYPYAFPQEKRDYVSRFRRELQNQNYRAGVTTAIGRFDVGDDPLCIRRLPVNEADDLSLFRAKLAGAYDWVGTVQSAWKSRRAMRAR